MTFTPGLERLITDWLPKAERWVEQERDKTIEALLLCYQSLNVDAEKAWSSLPAFYQRRFPRNRASLFRVPDGRILHVATAGDLTSWRSLLGACGLNARSFAELDNEGDAFNALHNFEWWVFLNFTYAQCGVLDCEVGGKRRNLDPGFGIQLDSRPVPECRFNIDEFALSDEFSEALKESAVEFGYFATITDLRLSTIASIRWMRDMAIRSAEQYKQKAKRVGPYLLPPQNRKWEDVAEQSKLRFERDLDSNRTVRTCLLTMGRLWFDIVAFDPNSDHYTLFGENIELIWLWYYETRRQWDRCKAGWPKYPSMEVCKIPCDSVADGAIEFFDIVVVDVLDAVRGEVRLANYKLIDQDWAAHFSERLAAHLDEVGIANKPLDASNLRKRLERELPKEEQEAELAGIKTAPTMPDAKFRKMVAACRDKQNLSWAKLHLKHKVSERTIRRWAAEHGYDLISHKFTSPSALATAFLELEKKPKKV